MLQAVVVADFNKDGKLDVAVASVMQSNLGGHAIVFLGNGDGTLQTPQVSSGDSSPIQMLAVDLNSDGKMDLVIGGNSSPQVLFGKGDGTFQPPVYLPCPGGGPSCFGVAVADFNGDGRLDVATVTSGWSNGSGVYMGVDLQNPDGTFTQGFSYALDPTTYQFGWGIAAGDLNGDGKADVVIGCYGSGEGAIFFGNGDGTFQAPQPPLYLGSGANSMVLADFDNDKLPDILVGNYEQFMSGAVVYVNQGKGVFGSFYPNAVNVFTAGGTTQVAYGDFNLDGYLDLVSADSTGNVVSVFLNTTGPPTQPLSVGTSGGGTIISGDGFLNCGHSCLHRYPTGMRLALTAMPSVGFTLANWTGCASHNPNVCGVIVNSATSVAATFSPVTVSFGSLAFTGLTVRPGSIAVGTLTLSAPAPPGGVTLSVISSKPSAVTVPSTIYLPGGASTFKFSARAISPRPTSVTITVSDGHSAVSSGLNVSPSAAVSSNAANSRSVLRLDLGRVR